MDRSRTLSKAELERWNQLDMSSMSLRHVSPSVSHYDHLQALYLSNNSLTFIPPVAFECLRQLSHLDLAYNRLTFLPPEIGNLVRLRALSLYGNRISELPLEMGRLFRLEQLALDGNPISSPPVHVLQQGTVSIIRYLRDHTPVLPNVPERNWIHFDENGHVMESPSAEEKTETASKDFSILSWNTLSDAYANGDLYNYTPSWALTWDFRKPRILHSMLAHDSDIICLQEVETEQYNTYFEPELAHMGYDSIFRPKSRARTMEDPGLVDGCAIFFKRSKFTLQSEHLFEFQSIAMSRHTSLSSKASSSGLDRLMARDNISVAAVLHVKNEQGELIKSNVSAKKRRGRRAPKTVQTPSTVIMVNAHVHWDPKLCDVKLVQAQLLLEEMEELSKLYPGAPVILAGDFNSTPDSGVYELLHKGSVRPDHPDFKGHTYGSYTESGLKHGLQLTSAYGVQKEPPFTNYVGDFVGCIDYIFFSEQILRVKKVLETYTEEQVRRYNTALPNPYNPSDHMPLACVLGVQGE